MLEGWRLWHARLRNVSTPCCPGNEALQYRRSIDSATRAERSGVRVNETPSRALGALGGIAYWQNDYPVARVAYEEAVDIAREMNDARLLASALLDLSYMSFVEQDADGAELILRQGLAAAQEADDRLLTAELWDSIAFLEVVRGNPRAAIPLRRRAIAIFREEGDVWNLANLIAGLAMMTRMAGDLDAARANLREALGMFAQANDTMSIAMVLTAFAHVANDDGMPERAARLLGASARIRDEVGGGIPQELSGRWGDPSDAAKRALGDDAYERAHVEGYGRDTEAAVAYARDAGDGERKSGARQ